MAINKVVYGGSTLIDITDTTATASQVLDNYYFYTRAGVRTEGTCTFDANTKDATATSGEILYGVSAYVNGSKVNGSMTNRGAVSATISSLSAYTVPNGYHDGAGTVSVDSTNISAGNIKSGVTILGVEGTYTGAAITTQTKNVTPSTSAQIITADTAQGYDYLAQVNVAAIPYASSPNTYGTTITIG